MKWMVEKNLRSLIVPDHQNNHNYNHDNQDKEEEEEAPAFLY